MAAEIVELKGLNHSPLSKLVAESLRFEASHPEYAPTTLIAVNEQEKKELERIIMCMARSHKTRIRVEIDANAPPLEEA